MMNSNKKSQLGLLAIFFLFSLFVFFYSIETPNTFKSQPSKSYMINSIETQFCEHARSISDGIVLEASLNSFDSRMEQYCGILGANCNVSSSIFNFPTSGNLSQLTYQDVEMRYSVETDTTGVSNLVRCY